MSTPGNRGPPGQPRGIGFGILMFIVTLHFYSWYWVFKTQEEIRQHTGEGLGGVLGLVIWILLNPVEAFVIPSETGKMLRQAVLGHPGGARAQGGDPHTRSEGRTLAHGREHERGRAGEPAAV